MKDRTQTAKKVSQSTNGNNIRKPTIIDLAAAARGIDANLVVEQEETDGKPFEQGEPYRSLLLEGTSPGDVTAVARRIVIEGNLEEHDVTVSPRATWKEQVLLIASLIGLGLILAATLTILLLPKVDPEARKAAAAVLPMLSGAFIAAVTKSAGSS